MDAEQLERLRRQSQLAVTKEGDWTWGGNRVENPRVQELFHSGVAVREDGETIVAVGRMWAYFDAPVTAFFVRALAADGRTLRLCGGRELALGPGVEAGWGPDDRLYLWLPRLGGPAIALRDAHLALTSRLLERDGALWLEGAAGDPAIPVAMLGQIPTAAAPGPGPHREG